MVRHPVQSRLLPMLQYGDSWLGIQVRAFQHAHGVAKGPLGPETRCVKSTRQAGPRQDRSQESIEYMLPSRRERQPRLDPVLFFNWGKLILSQRPGQEFAQPSKEQVFQPFRLGSNKLIKLFIWQTPTAVCPVLPQKKGAGAKIQTPQ